ncbi:MAG: UDP-N-acetylglucosamine 2-epimerase (non-hydrolyzing) [Desulfurococcaceae archaeon]
MKVALVLGTRPEIIKMFPVITELEKHNISFFIIHTGQHYSYEMDRVFFDQLKLPKPAYNLHVGSGSHAEETGKMLMCIEKVLKKEASDKLLVQGDTNTVLAGALAAAKLGIKVGHVEAGLRSFDKGMPEEINRVLTDHLSDYLFAPTEISRKNLLAEGISDSKIFVTGNTIVDAVYTILPQAIGESNVFQRFEDDDYIVLTLHRAENVDQPERLRRIIEGVTRVAEHTGFRVEFPIHPRTHKRIRELDIQLHKNIEVMKPLGYFDFLLLVKNAVLVITDSGGVQEEACILKVPCVTVRRNTERPETLQVGANMLAGDDPDKILTCSKIMINKAKSWGNPFGDGRAAERIVKIISEEWT